MAIERRLPADAQPKRTLDFGSGDGWYWDRFASSNRLGTIEGVDVQLRDEVVREPQMYDGTTLPFEDESFDLAYAIDVLHHCPDPIAAISELTRCTNEWLVIKDHTHRNKLEFGVLSVLDEIGNRKFGIPSRYRYQRKWEWLEYIDGLGFEQVLLDWPVDSNGGLVGRYTKRLNFLGVWRRR